MIGDSLNWAVLCDSETDVVLAGSDDSLLLP